MNFKLKINLKRDRRKFRSIQWTHLQPSPISWDYPFNVTKVLTSLLGWRWKRISNVHHSLAFNINNFSCIKHCQIKIKILRVINVSHPYLGCVKYCHTVECYDMKMRGQRYNFRPKRKLFLKKTCRKMLLRELKCIWSFSISWFELKKAGFFFFTKCAWSGKKIRLV
jgi:hypothetical protein